eukprot:1867846-Amphidinium_carterae.1
MALPKNVQGGQVGGCNMRTSWQKKSQRFRMFDGTAKEAPVWWRVGGPLLDPPAVLAEKAHTAMALGHACAG